MKTILILLALAVTGYAQTLINGGRVVAGPINYCADAGASDAYACNLSPAITAYVDGACYGFKANTANTGAATINLNGVGAVAIKKAPGGVTTDLSDNDIRVNQLVAVCYDGANMQMQSTLGNAGGGGGGGAVNAATAPWWPWFVDSGGTGEQVAGAANAGTCHRFTPPGGGLVSGAIAVNVTTGSGTSCTGGVCGYGVAIYNNSGVGVAYSEKGTSNHGTASKNINTPTGVKRLVWASGSAVSGGTLTLAFDNYYLCHSSDSTALQTAILGNAQWQVVEVALIPNSHGWQTGFSTGNGGSLTLPANKSGTFTHTGNGSTNWIMAFN